jgi:3',5'-nucleoside bisphosphate phosphatase
VAPVRDFHAHSNCSDGTFGPSEVVRYAANAGVEELSLTDHDTLTGLDEAMAAAQAEGIAFLPGIELTCRFGGRMIHILGYGFDPATAAADAALARHLAAVKQRDHEWARSMCEKSCADPLVARDSGGRERRLYVTPEELSWVRGTMQSPFHVAVVLSKKLADISDELNIPARHCMYLFTGRPEPGRRTESHWPEIRERYAETLARHGLAPGTRWWVPRPTSGQLDAPEGIAMIDGIGGIPVLAHPGEQNVGERDVRDIAALGVRGVEIYTFKHAPAFVAELEVLTEQLGLFATGGSDFHGPHHRAQIAPGMGADGEPLKRGLSIADFGELGARVFVPQ